MNGGAEGVENPFPSENKEGWKEKLSLGHFYEDRGFGGGQHYI